MSKKLYRIRYGVDVAPLDYAGFAPDCVSDAPKQGLTDQLLIASVLANDDGSSSTCFFGYDGVTSAPMSSFETAKVWFALSHHIAESTALSDKLRKIASDAVLAVQLAMEAEQPHG